jgi:hypothetical protein
MASFCGFSALGIRNRFSASIASLLILLFLFPPGAYAKAKPLDAATVHARILKRGIGNPVGVEQSNGVELVGRIIAVNMDSFTLQLFNDPQPVTINYADVAGILDRDGGGDWGGCRRRDLGSRADAQFSAGPSAADGAEFAEPGSVRQ